MHILGLEPERFSAFEFASHEKDRLLEALNSFAKKISTLTKSPLSP
jgi:coenzyme F420-reducing hydrogenase delta subunit